MIKSLSAHVAMVTKSSGTLTPYYYHYDEKGSITKLTDKGGNTVQDYTYDAFGNLGTEDDALYNPICYTGQYTDSETGLIYLRNRYYDPTIGRFTQEDPIKDGLNWYVYCANDPLNKVDPSGTIAESDEEFKYSDPTKYALLVSLTTAYNNAYSDDDRNRIHEVAETLRGTDTRITNILFMNNSEGAFGFGHTGLLLMNSAGQGFLFSFWHDENIPTSPLNNKSAEMRFSVLSKDEVDELKDGYGSIGRSAVTYNGYRRDEVYDRFVWDDVTAEQGARMFNEAAYLFSVPGEYNLISATNARQCDIIAQEILSAGDKTYSRKIEPNNTYFSFKGDNRVGWRNKLGEERGVNY